MKRGYIITALALMWCSWGCFKADQDVIQPVVRIIEPFEGSTHLSGDVIDFVFEATDQTELYEMDIRIHENSFDHNETAPSWVFAWDTIFKHRIFGQRTDLRVGIPIPANLKGAPYHAVVKVLDGSGNISAVRYVNFDIQATGDIVGPTITAQESIQVGLGTTFFVQGNVTDDTYVQSVNFRLMDNDSSTMIHESNYPQVNMSNYNILEFIPAPLVDGDYTLIVTAADPFDNVSQKSITITLL